MDKELQAADKLIPTYYCPLCWDENRKNILQKWYDERFVFSTYYCDIHNRPVAMSLPADDFYLVGGELDKFTGL